MIKIQTLNDNSGMFANEQLTLTNSKRNSEMEDRERGGERKRKKTSAKV